MRAYRPSDRRLVGQCAAELLSHLHSLDPQAVTAPISEYGARYARHALARVASGRGFILVGEHEGVARGIAIAWEAPVRPVARLEEPPTRIMFLADLVVLAPYRGAGLGSVLLSAVEEEARKRGCDTVQLGVFAPNHRAHALYEAQGYHDREVLMRKQVAPRQPEWKPRHSEPQDPRGGPHTRRRTRR